MSKKVFKKTWNMEQRLAFHLPPFFLPHIARYPANPIITTDAISAILPEIFDCADTKES
jgi:hypothetical protein